MAFLASLIPSIIEHGPQLIEGAEKGFHIVKNVFDMFHGKPAGKVLKSLAKKHLGSAEARANTLKTLTHAVDHVSSVSHKVMPATYHHKVSKVSGNLKDLFDKASKVNKYSSHLKI
jgi:hypothetical protein